MARYFKRASSRSVDNDGWAIDSNPYGSIAPTQDERPPHIIVDEHWDTNTGLLDVSGEEIWRAARPIGFGRDEEW